MEQKIELRIFNRITLNYNLLYEILTAACSYFIVLIQYELDV